MYQYKTAVRLPIFPGSGDTAMYEGFAAEAFSAASAKAIVSRKIAFKSDLLRGNPALGLPPDFTLQEITAYEFGKLPTAVKAQLRADWKISLRSQMT